MSRIDPDRREHPREKRMDWHRRLRGTFIAENLRFSPELVADQTEVRDAYQKWIGEHPNRFLAMAIHDLNKSITCMGADLDEETRTFKKVGLRT